MVPKTVLLTGATGLVGSYLLKLLLKNKYKVFVIARDDVEKCANDRVIRALEFWDRNLLRKTKNNLIVFKGDITRNNLGLTKRNLCRVINEIEEIYHCAANTAFNLPIDTARLINVKGTENVLILGLRCRHKGKLAINHISTIFVCGDYKGKYDESCLNVGQKFNTTYEKSKFEAELLVDKYRKKGLSINVFRPPVIIGESLSGKILTFNQTFYQILHILNSGILQYFPENKRLQVHIVCVNDLCESIFRIANNVISRNRNYHAFPAQGLSSVKLLNIAQETLKFQRLELVSAIMFLKKSTYAQQMLLKYNFFFLNDNIKLCSYETNILLNDLKFKYSVIDKKLLKKIITYFKIQRAPSIAKVN